MSQNRTLDQVDKSVSVRIVRISGGWGVRRKLNHLGLHVGDSLVIKQSGIMGGPILIKLHGQKMALGRGMAGQVEVEVLD